MEQRFTFDGVAALYGEARPTYPELIFDNIAAFAGLGGRDTILEIGCGTGQATQGFALRGFSVLALEPGKELIGIARKNLSEFPNIRFAETTFEAWPGKPETFKLVMAAQSFHWVAPDVRFAKTAEQLAPGGTLAVFGNVPMPPSSPLAAEFARLYSQYAPSLSSPPVEAWYLPDGAFAELLGESEYFEPATHRCYPWSQMHSADSYTDLLRTLSSHRLLADEQRETLLAAIAEVIVMHGGEFELRYETHLYMAKRRREK
ncbi:methyltransferase domain-containing protein [Rhizobium sp. CB3090]|uniref:class I SAM-dependent methyltransferase n=1 Tax=Rhizobium sp. CB3090 TaxID=3039156 RepID=UPI0024B10109|nr:class I SAM-dependent methyltransferase [Rhizobium sp. CB3090]WFU09860.1 methyltransferase domain-containing protein [Rhizobium sp. CB3090]